MLHWIVRVNRQPRKKNVSPTQLIGASGDKMLWHRIVANTVNHHTAP